MGVLIAASLLFAGTPALGQPSLPPPNPSLEGLILHQVASGEEADLKKEFPDEKDRVLSAQFLEKLLTNSLQGAHVHRHGVQIRSAIVHEPLDLVGAEVPFETFLLDCSFLKEIDLSKSIFMKGLSFDGSTFASPARFHAMRVGRTASFDRTIFMRGADFSEVATARNMKANEAEFRNGQEPAFFAAMKVGGYASFISTKFSGPAVFVSTDINTDLNASAAEFSHPNQMAVFKSVRVGGTAFFVGAKFSGPVDFFSADIRGHLEANAVEFRNTSQVTFLNSMRVGGNASFISAKFLGPVAFENAVIQGNLRTQGAEFRSAGGKVSFVGMRVGGDIISEGALFLGEVNFDSASIAGHLNARGVRFVNTTQLALFNNMKVGGHAYLFDARFSGPVSFVSATISGDLHGNGLQFLNSEQRMTFNLMKVGGNVYLPEAKFSGHVAFFSADVRGHFEANWAEFRSTNFNNLKVGGNLQLPEVKFSGPVSFVSAEVGGDFEANQVEFRDSKFNNMKVGGTVNFHGAKFLGEAIFIGTEVKGNFGVQQARFLGETNFMGANTRGNFEATMAEFKNPDKEVVFSNAKVGGDVTFSETQCLGPVSFMNTEITGDIVVSRSQFERMVNFNTMKVNNWVRMIGTTFSGGVSMNDARFLHVNIQGSQDGDAKGLLSFPLDLSRTEIKGELSLKHVALREMIASALQVAGPTTFKDLIIEDQLDLEHSSFSKISMLEVTWPKARDAIRLNGMTYRFISAGDDEDSWKRLLELVKRSYYDANVYTNLESFFRSQGYLDQADEVFIEHKRVERQGSRQKIKQFWSVLLEYLVWHGRKPQLALLWSLVIIFAGSFVFNPKGMKPKNPDGTSLRYNALWFSLDLFLPVVDLGVANNWVPLKDRCFARNYAYIHKILGALMIPLGLAAVTGIIK
jgi:hypothetical protein